MIATLRFNLENEDDLLEFDMTQDASQMSYALSEALQYIRTKLKYTTLEKEAENVLVELRIKLLKDLEGCKTQF